MVRRAQYNTPTRGQDNAASLGQRQEGTAMELHEGIACMNRARGSTDGNREKEPTRKGPR